jgi:antiviral defense system Shedu protein SduA
MTEKYEFQRTSLQSAAGSDKVLAESDSKTTRLLLENIVVENQKNPDAKIKISFVHQRKTLKGTWEDTPTKPLSSLKAGEQIKLILDSKTTLELFHHLENLYAIATKGKIGNRKTSLIVAQESEVIVTDANRAAIIRSLLSKGYSNDVWQELVQADPDLATRLSYSQIHAQRKLALDEFQKNLTQQKDENWWQGFFEKNPWIFGYGLNYKFSTTVQTQPQYGGVAVTGKGMQKGDTLQKTEAEIKFTVLVEIKKPNTQLLGNKPYRNGAWELGGELTGGVSQMQANCRTWEKEGSQTAENAETLLQEKIFTVQPKGILVIGHTNQLSQIPKRTTFELFRRNTVNPEILTFDELYERAKFIVEQTDETPPAENDDCPF